MSFGYSIGDGVLLAQLAWTTVKGARQACGEHDELTREVSSLHRVLQRLHRELANPDSLLHRAEDDRRQELDELGKGCEQILNIMNSIVTKYNKLSDKERSGKRLWQKVKFGNGEVRDLADIRRKLSAHTSALLMSLNLCSLGSQGRAEKQLNDVGRDLKGIRGKVDWIAAKITAKGGDGTVWTSYENDDKAFWRELRRELVVEGYDSSVLQKHKQLLKEYIKELGSRGVFDQVFDEDSPKDDPEERESDDSEPENIDSEDEDANSADADSVEVNSKDTGSEDTESDDSGRSEAEPAHPETEDNAAPTLDTVKSDQLSQDPMPKQSSSFAMPAYIEEILDEEFATNLHPNSFGSQAADKHSGEAQLDVDNPQNTVSFQTPDLTVALEAGEDDPSPADSSQSVKLSVINEMSERLAYLERLTKEQEERLKAVHRDQATHHSASQSAAAQGEVKEIIMFKNAVGRTSNFPFDKAMTWEGFNELMRQDASTPEEVSPILDQGTHYDLVAPDGKIINRENWEELIQPDWLVSMEPQTDVLLNKESTLSEGRVLFPESFFRSSVSQHDEPERLIQCLVCLSDDIPRHKSAKLKCGHRMCHSCLKRIFKLSIVDPQHMPPKCCTADRIPLEHVDRLFDNKFKKNWNTKYTEYFTKNRIYCPARQCGEWIKPGNIHKEDGKKYGKCSRCKTKVCSACHSQWHGTKECPEDEEMTRFLGTAKRVGWQQCYSCRTMIELQEGNCHMICRCGAEFCMVCSLRWKSCRCLLDYEEVEADRLNHMQIPEPEIPRPDRLRRPRLNPYSDEISQRRQRAS